MRLAVLEAEPDHAALQHGCEHGRLQQRVGAVRDETRDEVEVLLDHVGVRGELLDALEVLEHDAREVLDHVEEHGNVLAHVAKLGDANAAGVEERAVRRLAERLHEMRDHLGEHGRGARCTSASRACSSGRASPSGWDSSGSARRSPRAPPHLLHHVKHRVRVPVRQLMRVDVAHDRGQTLQLGDDELHVLLGRRRVRGQLLSHGLNDAVRGLDESSMLERRDDMAQALPRARIARRSGPRRRSSSLGEGARGRGSARTRARGCRGATGARARIPR